MVLLVKVTKSQWIFSIPSNLHKNEQNYFSQTCICRQVIFLIYYFSHKLNVLFHSKIVSEVKKNHVKMGFYDKISDKNGTKVNIF